MWLIWWKEYNTVMLESLPLYPIFTPSLFVGVRVLGGSLLRDLAGPLLRCLAYLLYLLRWLLNLPLILIFILIIIIEDHPFFLVRHPFSR